MRMSIISNDMIPRREAFSDGHANPANLTASVGSRVGVVTPIRVKQHGEVLAFPACHTPTL